MCPLVAREARIYVVRNRLFVVMIALVVTVTMWAAVGAMVGAK